MPVVQAELLRRLFLVVVRLKYLGKKSLQSECLHCRGDGCLKAVRLGGWDIQDFLILL